jgi:hypothetical protein
MLIGILGFAGSGKGTVADILVRDHGFHKLSFADALKDSVATIFGWERHLLEGDTDESREFRETIDPWWSERFAYDVTPRYMLQLMGTEAGRNAFHIDIWIHTVARRMMQYENVVIADVRFPNEINFIRENGGFNVRVVRGKDPEWYEIARRANLEKNTDLMYDYSVHYSEWAWIGHQTNYELSNNSSLAMLEADVKHMLRVHSGPAIIELHSEK